MPNRSRSLTCVKPATMAEGKTTGIRLKITMDMIKKKTIQEIGLGLIFCNFDDSAGFSFDSFSDRFSCLFLNLAKLGMRIDLQLKTQAVSSFIAIWSLSTRNRLCFIDICVASGTRL